MGDTSPKSKESNTSANFFISPIKKTWEAVARTAFKTKNVMNKQDHE